MDRRSACKFMVSCDRLKPVAMKCSQQAKAMTLGRRRCDKLSQIKNGCFSNHIFCSAYVETQLFPVSRAWLC